MKSIIAAFLLKYLHYGRCPCCSQWTRFGRSQPLLTDQVPVELQGLVPRICKCQKSGCTSSVRAITSLELRAVTVEA